MYLFSSESVSAGHPDKLADQIADATLDAILLNNSTAKVACEVLIKSGLVLVAGEINTTAWVDIESIARSVLQDAGYVDHKFGFDSHSCAVVSAVGNQSSDIAAAVERQNPEKLGAGDQGMVFGFACDETPELMPFPILCAHRLMQQHKSVFQSQKLPWIGPDAKAQVTVRYTNAHKPIAIDTIVLSTQHLQDASYEQIKNGVLDEIIRPVLSSSELDYSDAKFIINPSGRFVIGGPSADCGLTGRKIIVDTYGGFARHGGGAFSGKDPTKVDRSGAYMARHIAKSIVAAGIARRCEIQISYAIGIAEPISLHIDCFGTAEMQEKELLQLIHSKFDLRPFAIIKHLKLLRPIYRNTSTFGHFGRETEDFPWEKVYKI